MGPGGGLTEGRLREGVCAYNETPHCICRDLDKAPLSQKDYDEFEWRLALERKGRVEIFGFLCEWDMGRTLTSTYRVGKPSLLWNRVQPVLPLLDSLNALDLLTFRDANHGIMVAKAFDVLRIPGNPRNGIGITSPAKVLHALHPRLFVPWDEEIRGVYDAGSDGVAYRTFLETCRREVEGILRSSGATADQLCQRLYLGGWKPLTKILDEFHISKAHRYAPHFLK